LRDNSASLAGPACMPARPALFSPRGGLPSFLLTVELFPDQFQKTAQFTTFVSNWTLSHRLKHQLSVKKMYTRCMQAFSKGIGRRGCIQDVIFRSRQAPHLQAARGRGLTCPGRNPPKSPPLVGVGFLRSGGLAGPWRCAAVPRSRAASGDVPPLGAVEGMQGTIWSGLRGLAASRAGSGAVASLLGSAAALQGVGCSISGRGGGMTVTAAAAAAVRGGGNNSMRSSGRGMAGGSQGGSNRKVAKKGKKQPKSMPVVSEPRFKGDPSPPEFVFNSKKAWQVNHPRGGGNPLHPLDETTHSSPKTL
jgi:hypothetical protein